MKESGGCQNEVAEEEGSDGSPGLAGVRGRPSTLPVTADRQQQEPRRRIGVAGLEIAAGLNNNNNNNLSVSDLSDMSSESDSEFPQVRLNGDGEGNINIVLIHHNRIHRDTFIDANP